MTTPWVLRHPTLRVLAGLCALWALSFGLTIPFLTLTARDRGISIDAIGVIAASYLLTQIFLQFPFGALSDRIGRIKPLAAGIALFSLATASFTLADSTVAFIVLRATQGIAFALAFPAYRALIADVTSADQRGQAYATLGMAYSSGLLLGPALGGLLVGAIGRDTLFLVTAGIEAGLAVGVIVLLRGAGRPGQRAVVSERVPLALLFVRPLLGAFLLAFVGHLQYGFFESIWGLYVADLGGSDLAIGLAFSTFAVANLLMSPFGGRIADRGNHPRWLLVGFLGLAAVMIGYGLVPWVPGILVLGLCEGAVAAIAFPTLDAFLAANADPRVQGRVQGMFSSSMMAGSATSALGGAVLYTVAPGLPFVVGGAMVAILTVVAVGLIRPTGWSFRSPVAPTPAAIPVSAT